MIDASKQYRELSTKNIYNIYGFVNLITENGYIQGVEIYKNNKHNRVTLKKEEFLKKFKEI